MIHPDQNLLGDTRGAGCSHSICDDSGAALRRRPAWVSRRSGDRLRSAARMLAVCMAVALLATALLVARAAPARADNSCNADDMLNALQSALNSLSSGCSAAAADPADWGALVGMTAGAGIAQAAGAPQFCQAVQGAYNAIQSGSQTVSDVQARLQPIMSALPSTVQNSINQALDGLAGAGRSATDALSVVSCACSVVTDPGIGQLAGDVLSCLQDAICFLQDNLPGFNQCMGSTNTTWVNCAQDPCAGRTNQFGCTPNPSIGYIANGSGQGGAQVECTQSSSGEVCWSVLGADSNGNVTVLACYCPAPMQLNTSYNGGMYDQYGDQIPYLLCSCPQGTTQAGSSGALSDICICNNTHLPAQSPGGPGGICPSPLTGAPCPSGQVNVGGQCITPCSDPSQVMLGGGTCCLPAQATSCGVCCPSGQTPDLASGNCVPTATSAPLPLRPLNAR
jgi:hypothetical protein